VVVATAYAGHLLGLHYFALQVAQSQLALLDQDDTHKARRPAVGIFVKRFGTITLRFWPWLSGMLVS
jgi:hypothetical protein